MANYYNLIMQKAKDQDRQAVQHKAFRDNFLLKISDILDNYGLAQRLETSKPNSNDIVRIVDAGCGEGLYLQDVATLLESRKLLAGVKLYGVDADVTSIVNAERLSQNIKPPRPYLNFYTCNLNKGLSSCLELHRKGIDQFDFIYLNLVLEYLPNAQAKLQNLYESLKPGGTIYIHSFVSKIGENGWLPPHLVMLPFCEALLKTFDSINNGIVVAEQVNGWLSGFGAEQVKSSLYKAIHGGSTEMGKLMLRNGIMGVYNAGPGLITQGLLTQDQLDHIMNTLFKELSKESVGHLSFMDVIARRPL